MSRVLTAIEAFRGAVAAITVPSGESEERREQRTEFFEEDGRRVERLVAKCGSCGQPVVGRRVIRFTKYELQQWQVLDRDDTRLCRLGGLGTALSTLVAVGLAVWTLVESRLLDVAVVAGLLGGVGLWAYTMWRIHQAEKELDRSRSEILRRHGDIKPKQAGMVWDHKSFVILPAS